jgi:membrane protease YdiL (CAAX protease family)
MESAAALAGLVAMMLWLGSLWFFPTVTKTGQRTTETGDVTISFTISPSMPVLAALLVFDLLVIGFAWRLARRGGHSAAEVLALRAPIGGAKTILAIVGVMAAVLAAEIATAPLYRAAAENGSKLIANLVQQSGWPLAIATIGIVGPIAEEVWLRGFLLPALAKSRLGFWGAGLLTCTLFAALHAAQYALVLLVPLFVVGIVLTWALGLTGSLWVPIAIHMANNLFGLLWTWLRAPA